MVPQWMETVTAHKYIMMLSRGFTGVEETESQESPSSRIWSCTLLSLEALHELLLTVGDRHDEE